MDFEFNATLWLYQGTGAWVFATVPTELSEAIKLITNDFPREGFGSIKVLVTVNGVEWHTSIFPDSKLNAYLLPIKKDIRNKASISVGDDCEFTIRIATAL